ncbi:MAG: beta-galactosidase family protein [bacterium]
MKKLFSVLLIALSVSVLAASANAKDILRVKDGQFYLDGQPFRIMSGEMHYARIPEAYWQDRLLKARAMGLNTVTTYVFWNVHETRPGAFDFSDQRDLKRFIKLAQRNGLRVILRISPYVCAEWDFGGLPSWLLKDRGLRIRSMYPGYMSAVKKYMIRLGEEVGDLQSTRNGPIIMVQLENEYGSYGNDKKYMTTLRDIYKEAGFDVLFSTADGPESYMLEAGAVDGAIPTVNFGAGAENAFKKLAEFRTGIPEMTGEYWVGWITHWGDPRWMDQSEERQKKELKWLLDTGKSFNLYMFHGGTNFGFTAGANDFGGKYAADVTSYDYGAPLSESGEITPEYKWMRALLVKYQNNNESVPEPPAPLPAITIPDIKFTSVAPLFSNLPDGKEAYQPEPIEMFNQYSGYVLYRTKLIGRKSGKLTIHDLHDYGYVYLDGKLIGELDRQKNENSINIPASENKSPTLDILVEALGRVNSGPLMIDRKGITDFVELEGMTLMNWQVFCLPMDEKQPGSMRFGNAPATGMPAVHRATFELAETGDSFLMMDKWNKGAVWVNGHNLGRYWSVGPQKHLFVPGCWLKKGKNEILVFELKTPEDLTISSSSKWPYKYQQVLF